MWCALDERLGLRVRRGVGLPASATGSYEPLDDVRRQGRRQGESESAMSDPRARGTARHEPHICDSTCVR